MRTRKEVGQQSKNFADVICTCPLGWLVGRRVVGNFSLLILFMVRRKRAIVIAHRRHFLLERGRENERNIDRQASQSKR